jgi:hypothetical protein
MVERVAQQVPQSSYQQAPIVTLRHTVVAAVPPSHPAARRSVRNGPASRPKRVQQSDDACSPVSASRRRLPGRRAPANRVMGNHCCSTTVHCGSQYSEAPDVGGLPAGRQRDPSGRCRAVPCGLTGSSWRCGPRPAADRPAAERTSSEPNRGRRGRRGPVERPPSGPAAARCQLPERIRIADRSVLIDDTPSRGHARSAAPCRWAATATAASRAALASSLVNVRSEARKRSEKASDRLPAPACSPT